LTDENSSDLDRMGSVPYLGSKLVEETFRPCQNVSVTSTGRHFLCGQLMTNPKSDLCTFLTRWRWYGHVQRMAERRLPKIALKWMEGIRKAMNERNLNEGQWEDRKQWSLGVGHCSKTF